MTTLEYAPPRDKAGLLDSIRREWDLLMKVAGRLDEQEMIAEGGADGWSPKDHLAHLADWLNVLTGHYMDKRPAHEVMGVAREVTRDWEFEARRELLYQRSRPREADEVMSTLSATYEGLLARLEAREFEDLTQPRHPFDQRTMLDFVVRGSYQHFADHRQRIEKQV